MPVNPENPIVWLDIQIGREDGEFKLTIEAELSNKIV